MDKQPLKSLALCLLRSMLSGNGKRIVFLVTTYLELTQRTKLEEEDYRRLINSSLHIARCKEALLFPSMLKGLVWSDERVNEAISKECHLSTDAVMCQDTAISISMRACSAIVEITPKWLRYGRRDDMYRDLVALVSVGREPDGLVTPA